MARYTTSQSPTHVTTSTRVLLSTGVLLVAATVAMAHSLGMQTTAEGIESADQLPMLRMYGCDDGQGYYFGRPIAAREISHLLAATTEDGTPDPDVHARQ